MEVAITRRISSEAVGLLQKEGFKIAYHDSDEPPSRDELKALVKTADAIYCVLEDRINEEIIRSAPKLKVIATLSVGFNHIDLSLCRSRHIKVGNTPGVLTAATADIACILILSACRRIPEAMAAVQSGEWSSWKPLWMCGKDLSESTLGIVGMGRIGFATAKRMSGFGCKIIYSGPHRKPEYEREINATYVAFEELLKQSDIVSLHCPLTDDTLNLIGKAEFDMMKADAIIVNTARGTIINQEELYDALSERKIQYAALDVTTPEPLDPEDKLLKLKNVMVLPHIGSATLPVRLRMMRMTSQNIVAGLKGEAIPYEVLL